MAVLCRCHTLTQTLEELEGRKAAAVAGEDFGGARELKTQIEVVAAELVRATDLHGAAVGRSAERKSEEDIRREERRALKKAGGCSKRLCS